MSDEYQIKILLNMKFISQLLAKIQYGIIYGIVHSCHKSSRENPYKEFQKFMRGASDRTITIIISKLTLCSGCSTKTLINKFFNIYRQLI